MLVRTARKRRGRPPEGQRVTVRLAPHLIAFLDRRATTRGVSRAQVIREIVADATDPAAADGVDRTQIQRMLRMTPAERLAHMTDVANGLLPLRGVAVRR